MVIRVLPAKKGGIYSNAGSSHFLVNYLEHEAREEKLTDKAIFFDQQREGIGAEEVQERIDTNVQGLQKDKPRFHSLVISPSQDELRHLDNDPEKLTAYTRQVMENYAANFTDKRKRHLKSDDLIWYATIHRSRHYSGLDDAVQTGAAQPKQTKEGEQTHVHVIVSARDKTMSRSLHPDSGSRRFNYEQWLTKNQQDFERGYGYKQITTETQHQQRLNRLIDRLDRAGLPLDKEQMATIGKHHNYSSAFWKGMSQVERGVKQGSIFTQNQAYERLKATTEPKRAEPNRRVPDERAIGYVESSAKMQKKQIQSTNTDRGGANVPPTVSVPETGNASSFTTSKQQGVTTGQEKSQKEEPTKSRTNRIELSPLLTALRFESVPETGEHVQTQDDDIRRKIRRRR